MLLSEILLAWPRGLVEEGSIWCASNVLKLYNAVSCNPSATLVAPMFCFWPIFANGSGESLEMQTWLFWALRVTANCESGAWFEWEKEYLREFLCETTTKPLTQIDFWIRQRQRIIRIPLVYVWRGFTLYLPESWCLRFNHSLDKLINYSVQWKKFPLMRRKAIFCFGNWYRVFNCFLGLYIPYVYLPKYSLESLSPAVSQQKANVLIPVIGVSNAVGRVVAGIVGDIRCAFLNPGYLTALSLMLCGVATCLVPYLASYWAFVSYALLFGFFLG